MLIALVLSLAVLGAEPLPEAAQKELRLLQGKWIVVRGERNGKSFDLPKDGDMTLIVEIKDDKWLLSDGKAGSPQADKARLVMIDPKTNPKCLDKKSVEKGVEGTMIESIYKIEGDTLTICQYDGTYKGKQKQRPSEFKSNDTDTLVMVLERLKK